MGGASDSEGTVEVCLGNLWGLVAESGWNLIDAQVVCSQLGFSQDGNSYDTYISGHTRKLMFTICMRYKEIYFRKSDLPNLYIFPDKGIQALNNSHYGKPRKPVHMSNVYCTGRELQIISCSHHKFVSLDERKEILHHVDVAGVSCQPQSKTMNQTNNSATNESCDLSSAASLLVPAYLTMLLVMAGFALAIV